MRDLEVFKAKLCSRVYLVQQEAAGAGVQWALHKRRYQKAKPSRHTKVIDILVLS